MSQSFPTERVPLVCGSFYGPVDSTRDFHLMAFVAAAC